jgi:4-amino-4-deoxy-L-arabinose transferase-like glycosyltransferase
MSIANTIIETTSVLLAGIFIWIGLAHLNQDKPIATRKLLLLLVWAGLMCRLLYAFFTPPYYAPDERAHLAYICYLAENRTFPVLKDLSDSAGGETEYHQPPLYYLALAPLFVAVKHLFSSLDGMVIALRLFSICLWGGNVWFGVVLLRRLQVNDRFMRVFVMGIICFLPTYTFTSAMVNNDNLLVTMSGGFLCLATRQNRSISNSFAMGLLLGLALLTKQSAAIFVPATILLSVLNCRARRIHWPTGFLHLAISFGVAGVVYFPWAFRNWEVYGTLTPEFLTFKPALAVTVCKAWPSVVYGIASASHNLIKTFWAVSGISNNVGYPFPLVGELLICLFFVLSLKILKPEWTRSSIYPKEEYKPVMTAFLLAMVLNIILALRFGYLLGMGQGRHLFPVLYPIGLLLAIRFRTLPLRNPAVHAAGFWITYAFSFEAFSLCQFP